MATWPCGLVLEKHFHVLPSDPLQAGGITDGGSVSCTMPHLPPRINSTFLPLQCVLALRDSDVPQIAWIRTQYTMCFLKEAYSPLPGSALSLAFLE